jgi:branched-chain amino acid transport system permease protein
VVTEERPRERRKRRLDRGLKVRTEGIYALSAGKEAFYLLAPRMALILGSLVLPIFMPDLYWQKVICIAGVFGLLSLAFDFLANYVGLICLGGALFMGIGGYIAGILNSMFSLPIWVTIPTATLVGALFSTLLLSPCFPLRGIYFAIVTLMYPLAASRIIEALDIWGGTEGMAELEILPNIWVASYTIIAVLLISLFALRRLVIEDMGLIFRGVKDNDQAVKACGISIARHKAYATFIASAIGCFAGAYLVHLYGWAGLSLFALDFSILPIAASVVGGMGTLVGPVLGAFILIPLTELLRELGTLRIVFYSLLLAGFIFFRPEGLMTYAQRKYHQFEHWVEV